MTSREFNSLYEDFLSFEDDLNLLNRTIADVYFWERIRIDIHQRLVSKIHDNEEGDDTNSTKEYLDGLNLILKNLIWNNPWLATEAEYLFYGKGRRKQLKKGEWWDIYIDPIVDTLDKSSVCFERPYRMSHRQPAKTASLRYSDIIEFAGTVPETIGLGTISFDEAELDLLKTIGSELQTRFGVSIPIANRVQSDLSRRRVQLPLFASIIRRVSPRIAFLTSSYYGRETFVEACQLEGVPVVELQHGTITKYHLGYSYPNGEKRAFPDYFFAFGEFWKDSVELPLPDENVYSVGYPYLNREAGAYKNVRSTDQVVFISQAVVGAELSKFATSVADSAQEDTTIVYKLHPKEYDSWYNEYPWLRSAPLEVVTDHRPLYRLFAESTAQVGVYSTALFEGLYFGLDTYVVDLPGNEYMDPIIEAECAERISEPAEFLTSDTGPTGRFDAHYFFENEPIANFKQYVSEIRNS